MGKNDGMPMTKHRVFYAWQSDHPNSICRSVIRRALEKTASKLAQAAAIQDAPREDFVTVDADTQGIPGSPPIAETILEKIAESDAFVADLTMMPTSEGHRASPNPNVLIEYGYALATLGDRKIIAVMNEAMGSPQNLPFDIQHKRWPIRYELAPDASDVNRENAQAGLVRDLCGALKQVLEALPSAGISKPSPSEKIESRNIWAMPTNVQLEDGNRVEIIHGPSVTIEIAPTSATPPQLSYAAMNAAATSFVPPGAYEGEGRTGRIPHCVFNLTTRGQSTTVRSASAVTDDSRLHSIDFALLDGEIAGEGIVPVVATERLLSGSFRNLLEVANRHLKLTPPLQAWVHLTGIADFKLAFDPIKFDNTLGSVLSNQIAHELLIESFDEEPDTLLGPLFEKLFDEAGVYERPVGG